MKSGNNLRTLLCLVLALTVFVISLKYMDGIFRDKTAGKRLGHFIESAENTDIFIIGDSQIADGIIPLQMYKDYGYKATLLYAKNNGTERYAPMLELALQYAKPSLIILNTGVFWRSSSKETRVAAYHEYADIFPLNMVKIRTTLSLYEDTMTRAEILFPFLTYHSRWNELIRQDFVPDKNPMKGFEYSTEVYPANLASKNSFASGSVSVKEDPEFDDDLKTDIQKGLDNLEAVIGIAASHNIPVLLITLPFETGKTQQRIYSELNDWALERGVAYINFVASHEMVNPLTDFRDNSHLNISGASRVTDYLGQYIDDNYLVPRHDDGDITLYSADYLAYLTAKDELIRNEDSIRNLLVMAADEDYNIAIYTTWDSGIYKSKQELDLIENIGLVKNSEGYLESAGAYKENLKNAVALGEDYFVYFDKKAGKAVSVCSPSGANDPSISRDASDYFPEDDDLEETDFYICIINNHTGEIIKRKSVSLVINVEAKEEKHRH